MLRIEDIVGSSSQAEYGGHWLPSRPEPFYSIPSRLKDAWAVFMYRAVAVQWPDQRKALDDEER